MARIEETTKGSYVIRSCELSKLWNLLEDEVGNVTSSVDCSDKIQRELKSWEDLNSYDNLSRKQILKLTLRAGSILSEKGISISFKSDESFSVFVTIECPERELLHLKKSVFDILEDMKHQVLSIFTGRGFIALCIIYLVGSWAIVRSTVNLFLYGAFSLSNEQMSVYPVLFTFLGLLPFVLLGYPLYPVFRKAIPIAYFAIGQGESRYENWKLRWRIVLGMISTLILIIVGGTIVNIIRPFG